MNLFAFVWQTEELGFILVLDKSLDSVRERCKREAVNGFMSKDVLDYMLTRKPDSITPIQAGFSLHIQISS